MYLPKNAPRSLRDNIHAAWLWSGRRAIIAGRAAAALHGAKWLDDLIQIEIVGPFNHAPPGIIVRREWIDDEDLVAFGDVLVTNPARTAFDLARHLPRGGAQSPKESWLRLALIDAGLPRPVTQIRVSDGPFVAYLDMGWEEPMEALEYDGDHHRSDRRQYVKYIRRAEMVYRLGWHVIKVINEDHPNDVVQWARDALNRRRHTPRLP